MNTPNPLLPQGALPPREKSGLYFKILMIFAIHIVVLGGILMEGCSPSKDKAKTDLNTDLTGGPAKSDPMSATPPDLAPPPAPTAPQPVAPPYTLPPIAPAPAPVVSIPAPAPVTEAVKPAPAATAGSVYVIAPGDMLSTISKKTGVSVKAIEAANPGLDPKKLQPKHKLQIPASTAVASTETPKPAAEAPAAASGDSTTYIVKSGDTLVKIAKAHNTSVKEIEALNAMKTSAIKATQKLKVPVMKMASAEAAPASAAPATAPDSVPGMPSAPVRAN